jgi:hypothetical protein
MDSVHDIEHCRGFVGCMICDVNARRESALAAPLQHHHIRRGIFGA